MLHLTASQSYQSNVEMYKWIYLNCVHALHSYLVDLVTVRNFTFKDAFTSNCIQ